MKQRISHFVSGFSRIGAVVASVVLAAFLGFAAVMGDDEEDAAVEAPVEQVVAIAASATTLPTTAPSVLDYNPEWGPDVVLMDQLTKIEGLYEPVPFDHKGHAHMAQIQGGCTLCHHRSPEDPETRVAAAAVSGGTKDQAEASKHPACRTCHDVKRTDNRVPGLKGAYHQQCLNCHREWTGDNNCVICHKPLNGSTLTQIRTPTPEEILGRMHEPVKEPEIKHFIARFIPADGKNVTFRHKEHTERFGFQCVTCHREKDTCASCHSPERRGERAKKVEIDRDWHQAHQRCAACHRRQEQTCNHCHYKDDQTPPPAFEHSITGQLLDSDHATLKCAQCHGDRGARVVRGQPVKMPPTCGGAACHKDDPAIAFPNQRPGPRVPAKGALTGAAKTEDVVGVSGGRP